MSRSAVFHLRPHHQQLQSEPEPPLAFLYRTRVTGLRDVLCPDSGVVVFVDVWSL